MITYRCDRCGHEHKNSGLVTNLHNQFGFEELGQSWGDIRDVCGPCFKEILGAISTAERETRQTIRQKAAALLGINVGTKR